MGPLNKVEFEAFKMLPADDILIIVVVEARLDSHHSRTLVTVVDVVAHGAPGIQACSYESMRDLFYSFVNHFVWVERLDKENIKCQYGVHGN